MTNKRPQLKQALLKEIQSKNGYVRKVDLYHIADKLEYSHESVGRELRDCVTEEILEVDYYKGKWKKKLAMYKSKGLVIKEKVLTETINAQGERVMRYE